MTHAVAEPYLHSGPTYWVSVIHFSKEMKVRKEEQLNGGKEDC